MAYNALDQKTWVVGADSGTKATSAASATVANKTTILAASSIYPLRKFLSITNNGAKWVFLGVGRVPTTTDYDYALAPTSGTIDSNYVQGGVAWWDSSVPQ